MSHVFEIFLVCLVICYSELGGLEMKNITISPISISEFDIFDTSSQSFAFTNLITSLSSLYDNSTHYVGEIRCSKVSTDYNVWKLLFAIALFLQGIIYVFFGMYIF